MRIIVIGNGMVGYKFCEKLIARKLPELQLIVFGEEMFPAYDRVHLSEYFAGKTLADLSMTGFPWYADNQVALHLGDPVTSIDREKSWCTIFSYWRPDHRLIYLLFRVLIKTVYLLTARWKTCTSSNATLLSARKLL